jgi:hypothetical protein
MSDTASADPPAATPHHHGTGAANDHVVVRARHACGVVYSARASSGIRGRSVCHDDEQRGQCTEKIFHFVILLNSCDDGLEYTRCTVGAYAKMDLLPKASATAFVRGAR